MSSFMTLAKSFLSVLKGHSQQKSRTSLLEELFSVSQTYARYMKILQHLKDEYGKRKQHMKLKRYSLLKNMIKRAITHEKLGVLPELLCYRAGVICLNAGVSVWMNIDDMEKIPEEEIPETLTLLRQKIFMIRKQLENLSKSFEDSRTLNFCKRYRLMKNMINLCLAEMEA